MPVFYRQPETASRRGVAARVPRCFECRNSVLFPRSLPTKNRMAIPERGQARQGARAARAYWYDGPITTSISKYTKAQRVAKGKNKNTESFHPLFDGFLAGDAAAGPPDAERGRPRLRDELYTEQGKTGTWSATIRRSLRARTRLKFPDFIHTPNRRRQPENTKNCGRRPRCGIYGRCSPEKACTKSPS